jgi:hypothetical protein
MIGDRISADTGHKIQAGNDDRDQVQW